MTPERAACLAQTDVVLVDIEDCTETLGQCIELAECYQRAHPEREVILDGDSYAIIARRRCA